MDGPEEGVFAARRASHSAVGDPEVSEPPQSPQPKQSSCRTDDKQSRLDRSDGPTIDDRSGRYPPSKETRSGPARASVQSRDADNNDRDACIWSAPKPAVAAGPGDPLGSGTTGTVPHRQKEQLLP